jgi:hypothetical protein
MPETIVFNGEVFEYPNVALFQLWQDLEQCRAFGVDFVPLIVRDYGISKRHAAVMLLAMSIGETNFTDVDVLEFMVRKINELEERKRERMEYLADRAEDRDQDSRNAT